MNRKKVWRDFLNSIETETPKGELRIHWRKKGATKSKKRKRTGKRVKSRRTPPVVEGGECWDVELTDREKSDYVLNEIQREKLAEDAKTDAPDSP